MSRIAAPEIDFDRDGRQFGYARLPWSSNRSAYGWVAIPIGVLRNGDGPTLLVTGGNHGDEYEGPVAATGLLRDLDVATLRGRVIVLPTLNPPAFEAATRLSPLDEVNLNRAFPGERDGTPTRMIAHWVETVLMPMATHCIDLHAGGKSLMYAPTVLTHLTGDPAIDAQARAMLLAFGAPLGFTISTFTDDRTLFGAAERNRVVAIGGEFGGGGAVSREGVAVAARGLRNVLATIGALPGEAASGPPTARLFEVGFDDYAYAPGRGVVEYRIEPGEPLSLETPFGYLHQLDTPLEPPLPLIAPVEGVMLCRRWPGPCERGDCLAQIGRPEATG